ncbi:glutaminyl-trna synthetase-like protein [Anopheles sinensis]|uniref:Glutaminyl-trna synthetase-like protein n=1 Tax=Anopheles sinensis TaxID=74873 RepID=A0A084VQ00_ANOSI|nr:glutaminyl-trna synthetase-like protein [Anopheles sinensis]
MKLPALLFGLGLITGVLSQGFGPQPPPFRPKPVRDAIFLHRALCNGFGDVPKPDAG